MARRRKLSTYTDETRQEKAKRLAAASIALRKEAYEALCTQEGWNALLEARLRHTYSWRNCALAAYQDPNAVRLGTFSQWSTWGFQVREGETSHITLVTRKGGKFSSASYFDVSQTNCPMSEEDGEIDADLLSALVRAVEPPRDVEDVQRAGNALETAYKRLTSTQEVSA